MEGEGGEEWNSPRHVVTFPGPFCAPRWGKGGRRCAIELVNVSILLVLCIPLLGVQVDVAEPRMGQEPVRMFFPLVMETAARGRISSERRRLVC